MTIQEIRELIDLVNSSGIAELELQRSENRVRIRRILSPINNEVMAPQAATGHVVSPSSASLAVQVPTHQAPPTEVAAPKVEAAEALVKSPIVGTYYDAPTPGDPPFVRVGDSVEKGQVLCIIESMKLMNEIESELAGAIVSKFVENGRPVEYGEALFAIAPR